MIRIIRITEMMGFDFVCVKTCNIICYKHIFRECIECKEDCYMNKNIDKFFGLGFEALPRCRCNAILSLPYIVIISELRLLNLLPDDFEPLCCKCFANELFKKEFYNFKTLKHLK